MCSQCNEYQLQPMNWCFREFKHVQSWRSLLGQNKPESTASQLASSYMLGNLNQTKIQQQARKTQCIDNSKLWFILIVNMILAIMLCMPNEQSNCRTHPQPSPYQRKFWYGVKLWVEHEIKPFVPDDGEFYKLKSIFSFFAGCLCNILANY